MPYASCRVMSSERQGQLRSRFEDGVDTGECAGNVRQSSTTSNGLKNDVAVEEEKEEDSVVQLLLVA